jgi:hypothetical protein
LSTDGGLGAIDEMEQIGTCSTQILPASKSHAATCLGQCGQVKVGMGGVGVACNILALEIFCMQWIAVAASLQNLLTLYVL